MTLWLDISSLGEFEILRPYKNFFFCTFETQSQGQKMVDKRKRKLLIIECNAPKLKAQGLSFSETLISVASTLLKDRLIHVIQAGEKEFIPTQFAKAEEKARNYSVIAVIGHSNSEGIWFSEKELYKWEPFTNWLKPFHPQKLFLMSCQGGKTEVSRILFRNLDSLREVYGSPVLLTKSEAMTIAGVALADLLNAKTAIEIFPIAQIISILNKGFIWKVERGDEADIGRELTEEFIRRLQNFIRKRIGVCP